MRSIATAGFLVVSTLAVGVATAPAGAAAPPTCPAEITVETRVELPGKPLPPGAWTTADKRETAKLAWVSFYAGHRGEELKAAAAQLKPDQKEENKKMTESWTFGPGTPVVALCHYKRTDMTVGIEMPAGIRACAVTMTRSGTKSYHGAGTAAMSCQ
jgi:hypothetical protein